MTPRKTQPDAVTQRPAPPVAQPTALQTASRNAAYLRDDSNDAKIPLSSINLNDGTHGLPNLMRAIAEHVRR